MPLLPYYGKDDKLVDGTLYKLLPFCKRNCANEKCAAYYQKLRHENSGSYCCPYGLSSFVYSAPDGNIIFTGLRIKGVYNKKLSKVTESKEYIYNPCIDANVCSTIAREDASAMYDKRMYENKFDSIKNLLHDARSLNNQIKNNAEAVQLDQYSNDDVKPPDFLRALRNAQISSYLISQTFIDLDATLNPSLTLGNITTVNVFKKFDKLRKLLAGYMGKNVWIELLPPKNDEGNNVRVEYEYAVHANFEKMLFNILENGVKYSPNNHPVQVYFTEEPYLLKVSIKSVGPFCDEDELPFICAKDFRGKHAMMSNKNGKGLGLSIAKEIATVHNIDLSFRCCSPYEFEGIKYGKFEVNMVFDRRKMFT